ncbi:hypothetical protein GA707_18605 [Nostocoides sp. F2B08]|uniref:hypothetical protein n=1 Tax=Nostocoides sp. F2B08 TaxID=2653936 RepID=UPI001263A108|nr:hypothetical protein [Tetrasphaera sp. F2B08]KAB7740909.1 hypothetical protein GA707_18605 [Tetrasphaera sp. F2B08]
MTTHSAVGAPPPLRGSTPWHLNRFAIACRASAIVLDLQGHPGHAAHLRDLAAAAAHRATQFSAQDHPTVLSAA